MNTTMHATIIKHVSSNGTTWHVKVEGEYMRTRFSNRRAFRSEANARKEVIRMLGDDVVFNTVSF